MHASDLFERITGQIIEAIQTGAGDFAMPWHRWGEGTAQPVNAASGRSYRGINTLLLWAAAEAAGYSSGRWGTYRQWTESGAQVRKGQKSTAILFWKSAANHEPTDTDREDAGPTRSRFVARLYHVFNAEQVDGDEAVSSRPVLSLTERVAAAEAFVAATGANIRHGGDRACYVANIDQIWLPRFEQFRDALSYYSVLAHETVHWSGAKHRLDRDLEGRFGSESYAMEELIAELGSAFIAGHLGLSVEPRLDHAAYVASWLRVLRDDPKAILTASSKAQEAFDYLIGLDAQSEQSGLSDNDIDDAITIGDAFGRQAAA